MVVLKLKLGVLNYKTFESWEFEKGIVKPFQRISNTYICNIGLNDRREKRLWVIFKVERSMVALKLGHGILITNIEKEANHSRWVAGSGQVKKNNTECVSCSNDGSCMVWDLTVSGQNYY